MVLNNRAKQQGFTLIELMITIAIVAILAMTAYPSYVDFIRTSDRSEAQRELLVIANLQEQFFLDQRAYTDDMTDIGFTTDPYITPSGNYSIDVTLTADGFDLIATAQGQQANDTDCLTMSVNEIGQKTATSATCWED